MTKTAEVLFDGTFKVSTIDLNAGTQLTLEYAGQSRGPPLLLGASDIKRLKNILRKNPLNMFTMQ